MRIKFYGLAFDYEPAREVMNDDFALSNNYLIQKISNFALINYYKGERKLYATNIDGFQTIERQIYIEMFMLDTNPRKFVYDAKDDMVYRILDTPISQTFEPNKKRMYKLPLDLINESEIKFDKDFIREKFNELYGVLNGNIRG